jgi:hypothetical protein
MTSILSSGLEGIARSQAGLQQASQAIASAGQAASGLAEPVKPVSLESSASPEQKVLSAVVDLAVYELQFKASARVIKTDDEVKGSMLDEFV